MGFLFGASQFEIDSTAKGNDHLCWLQIKSCAQIRLRLLHPLHSNVLAAFTSVRPVFSTLCGRRSGERGGFKTVLSISMSSFGFQVVIDSAADIRTKTQDRDRVQIAHMLGMLASEVCCKDAASSGCVRQERQLLTSFDSLSSRDGL